MVQLHFQNKREKNVPEFNHANEVQAYPQMSSVV